MEKSYIVPVNDFLICSYATQIYRPVNEFIADAITPSDLELSVDADPAVCRDFVFVSSPRDERAREEKYKNTNNVYE